jgi:splicing factor U2AF subunit
VVRLAKVLSLDQLQDDQVYQQVLDELTQEARKFGDLLKVVLPRPAGHGAAHPVASEDGKVFLEYACLEDSIQCRIRLDGQWFDGTKIIAGYFPEDKFAAGDYDYEYDG